MMDERDDPILDSCLEEVLGGQKPPDMTARIMSALQSPETTRRPSVVVPEAIQPKLARPSTRRQSRFRVLRIWVATAATIAVLIVGVTSAWLMRPTEPMHVPVTQGDPQSTPDNDSAAPPQAVATPRDTAIVQNTQEVKSPNVTLEPTPQSVHSALPQVDASPSPATTAQVAAIPSIPDVRLEPIADQEIIEQIDAFVRGQWQTAGLSPAQPASDSEWCIRVYDKLLGIELPVGMAERFAANKSRTKRADLVNTLLQDADYVELLAKHWGDYWTDLLVGPTARQEDRELLDQFLRRSLADGKPLDTLTQELLTASGSIQLGSSDFNGAAIYLASHSDRNGKHAQATGHVARVFLGLSLACVQCHNHPWSELKQQQFWELNAFFRQLQVRDNVAAGPQLTTVDFPGEGSTPDNAEVYYELRNGLLKSAYPVFLDGTTVPASGLLKDVDRRDLLAQFVVRSSYFREALVNRFWGELFGIGFTLPVDDLQTANAPSNPELLSFVAGQFAAHDFNVRDLLRWLTLSEAFSLTGSGDSNGELAAADIYFAQFPAPPTNTKPSVEMLRAAAEYYALASNGNPATPARVVEPIEPVTVAELRANMARLLTAAPDDIAARNNTTAYGSLFLASRMPTPLRIQHMFWATLHREPTKRELDMIDKMLEGADERATQDALQYVWWALTNNAETER